MSVLEYHGPPPGNHGCSATHTCVPGDTTQQQRTSPCRAGISRGVQGQVASDADDIFPGVTTAIHKVARVSEPLRVM